MAREGWEGRRYCWKLSVALEISGEREEVLQSNFRISTPSERDILIKYLTNSNAN